MGTMKNCASCGKTFGPAKRSARTCGAKCRQRLARKTRHDAARKRFYEEVVRWSAAQPKG